MKPMLKAFGTKRLKLKCGILLSTSAFKINLRRYNWGNNNRGQLGRVVQSDLIKPTLKPPEIKRVETEV
jgi:alpha-tubulin suppressor-like RCC1 family protein